MYHFLFDFAPMLSTCIDSYPSSSRKFHGIKQSAFFCFDQKVLNVDSVGIQGSAQRAREVCFCSLSAGRNSTVICTTEKVLSMSLIVHTISYTPVTCWSLCQPQRRNSLERNEGGKLSSLRLSWGTFEASTAQAFI